MDKLRTDKGITLIALIITVIVMLILAGVAVSAINGVGLFDTAKRVTEIYNNSFDENKLSNVTDALHQTIIE